MKILLAFPQADRQTGLFLKNALSLLGCQLEVVDPKIEPWEVDPMAEKFKPDVILCSRTAKLYKFIERIKQRQKVFITTWCNDVRQSVEHFQGCFSIDLIRLFNISDITFFSAKGLLDYFKPVLQNKIEWLPEAFDPEYYNNFGLTDDDHKLYDCEVMFTGQYKSTFHKDREKLITTIDEKFNTKLFGYSRYIRNPEICKAYQCAKIVLGNSAFPDIALSNSARDYKIMGCGGFLLTNNVKEFDTLFNIGIDCDVYKDIDDCVKKINFYLKNDCLRKQMALNGYKKVHAKHTFYHRMKTYLEIVEKCL